MARCEHKVSTLVARPGAQRQMNGGGHWYTPQYKRTTRCPNDATVRVTIDWRPGEVFAYCDEHAPRPNRNGKILGKTVEHITLGLGGSKQARQQQALAELDRRIKADPRVQAGINPLFDENGEPRPAEGMSLAHALHYHRLNKAADAVKANS